jgi:RNA methyltransferase, TrmH family
MYMKNTQNDELAVCGLSAVKKLEKNHGDLISRLYFTKETAPFFGGLCKKIAKNHGIYNMVEAEDLEKLCGSVHHQGVVAMIHAPEIAPLDSDVTDSWIKNGENALILDRIGNANNLGAIVRSAAFFGMKNIVISNDETQSPITTSSYRVAEGGMEYVTIYSVNSIPRLMEAVQGKMVRIGTDLTAKKTVSQLKSICTGKPALIVLGNEENGISGEVRSKCDELVIIPFAGMEKGAAEPQVESLNVAQAASIILYELNK